MSSAWRNKMPPIIFFRLVRYGPIIRTHVEFFGFHIFTLYEARFNQ